MSLLTTNSRPRTCFLGPLVNENDSVQIPYEVYECGNYSLAILTDTLLKDGQGVVLQNKSGEKKFIVESIKSAAGRYKLYSKDTNSGELLSTLVSEKVKPQTPRFDLAAGAEVFVRTFGSKQVFLLNLTNLSTTGFKMNSGNVTHKIPFRENTIVEVQVPRQDDIPYDFTLLGKIVWVGDDKQSKSKKSFGVSLIDFEITDIPTWRNLVKKREQAEFKRKSKSLALVT